MKGDISRNTLANANKLEESRGSISMQSDKQKSMMLVVSGV